MERARPHAEAGIRTLGSTLVLLSSFLVACGGSSGDATPIDVGDATDRPDEPPSPDETDEIESMLLAGLDLVVFGDCEAFVDAPAKRVGANREAARGQGSSPRGGAIF